jgi:hypothetical protein
LLDPSILPESIKHGDPNKITVPLLGKVKGESHRCQHLLYSMAGTSSKIPIKTSLEFTKSKVKLKDLPFVTRMIFSLVLVC